MAKRTYEERLRLDMPFGEALERYARTSPKEMHANIKRAKKKKPPGGKKAPPGGKVEGRNLVQLRDRRKRNHG